MSNNGPLPPVPPNAPPGTGNDFVPKKKGASAQPLPTDPLFASAGDRPQYNPASPSGGISADERQKIDKLKSLLHIDGNKVPKQEGGRADQFLPYLLVRSFAGDRGNRPYDQPGQPFQPFWESPDIWVAQGTPATTPEWPAIPPGPGSDDVQAGQSYTLYAHVWNLGRAPILGVKVEFYVVDPTFVIDPTVAPALFTARARVDLGPRTSNECHRLVKCPVVWTPTSVNSGHECLVVRAASVGDNVSVGHPFAPWGDRHVAQRNIHVISMAGAGAAQGLQGLLGSLEKTRQKGTSVQLLQVGAEGANAVRLVAPKLQIDPAVTSHVLAELGADGSLQLPAAASGAGPLQVARMVPTQVLPMAALTAAAPKPVLAAAPAASVAANAPLRVATSGATLATLLDHTTLLDPAIAARIQAVPPPKAGFAQVLRLACYQGGQVVGGYTLVVTA